MGLIELLFLTHFNCAFIEPSVLFGVAVSKSQSASFVVPGCQGVDPSISRGAHDPGAHVPFPAIGFLDKDIFYAGIFYLIIHFDSP